jgi:hypothetical protein
LKHRRPNLANLPDPARLQAKPEEQARQEEENDALDLGLAVKEDGVLITFDKGIQYLAGAEFGRNILDLE